MGRSFAIAAVLSCLAAPAWAQAQPATGTAAAPVSKPAVNKPAPKTIAAGKPAPAENGPCGLGVIVAVGDEFEVQRVGITIFGNEHAEVPIKNWGLDDLVFARVRAAAASGMTVRRIPYSKEAFPVREEQKGLLFRDMKAELIDLMRQITAGTNCQRYVLVSKSTSRFNSTNQAVRGVGIVNWNNPLRNQTYLFALSFIRVFDGRDLSMIRRGSAFIDDEPLLSRIIFGTLIRGPHRELNQASFPSAPAEAATNLALRDGVRAMLTASLDKTLPAMLRQ